MARTKTVLKRAQRELLGALAANRDYLVETETRILELVEEGFALSIPDDRLIEASGIPRSTFYKRFPGH